MNNEARFQALHAQHGQALLAYLLRRTENAADAADVLADVFVVVWRRIDDVPSADEARPWLYVVARRTLANHRRGASRRHALVEALASALDDAVAVDATPPDRDLLKAINSLDARDREIVCLTAWEQLTPSEIARVLEMKPATVRVRLHRARMTLAKRLGPEFSRKAFDDLAPDRLSDREPGGQSTALVINEGTAGRLDHNVVGDHGPAA